jgi:phenylacetate-CoA ligase
VYAVLLAGQPGAVPRLTVTTPLPEMVAALNHFRPEALIAYPSAAAALAEEQLQGRLRIAPGLVDTSSEVLTADMRRRIGQAFGLEPLDFYGTTEALVVAAGRQGQAGMDVLEDLVVVEVTDEHDRPVPPGVPGDKVLLTNLVNRVQPLLRYELTDSVTLAVVLREEAPADTPARVRAALAAELWDAGAVPPAIAVTPVPRIDRDPGHGAKFKLIRSRPAPSP